MTKHNPFFRNGGLIRYIPFIFSLLLFELIEITSLLQNCFISIFLSENFFISKLKSVSLYLTYINIVFIISIKIPNFPFKINF